MPKVESFYTPTGVVKFPKTAIKDKEVNFLEVPSTFGKDDKGKWTFQLAIDPKDPKTAEIVAMLDTRHKAIKGANFKPYKADKARKDPEDKDSEFVETGLIAINFTSGFPIKFIDSAKNEVKDAKVGWGSKVRVKFTIADVNKAGKVGVGRYAQVVQIVDLKEVGMDTSGFDEVEGGYKEEQAAKTADDIAWSE